MYIINKDLFNKNINKMLVIETYCTTERCSVIIDLSKVTKLHYKMDTTQYLLTIYNKDGNHSYIYYPSKESVKEDYYKVLDILTSNKED